MNGLSEKFDKLEVKLKELIEKNRFYRQKIENLEGQNEKLKNELKLIENKLKTAEEEKIRFKINQKLEKNDTGEIKRKINEMVREIDKCIAYLNK